MTHNILLKCDDTFFYKMLRHKVELQKIKREHITWEDYVKILFGFRSLKGGQERANGQKNN